MIVSGCRVSNAEAEPQYTRNEIEDIGITIFAAEGPVKVNLIFHIKSNGKDSFDFF